MPFDQLFSGKAVPTTPTETPSTAPAAGTVPATTAPSEVPSTLQALGAGLEQGATRDWMTTFIPAAQWTERNIPGVRWFDEYTGLTPENVQTANQQYQQQYGGSTAAMVGRLGGNVAASSAIPIPGAAVAGGVARGALAGGLGSALTSGGYGENPLMAGAQGALGGGVIGGVTSALVRPAETFLTNTAKRLGIDLTQGQARGGFLNRLEDLSAPFIGSGSGQVQGTQGAQVAKVVQRAMGVPETGAIDIPMVNAARSQAGNDMGAVAGRMSVDGSAPAGAGIAGTPPLSLTDRLDQIYNQATALGTDTPQARAADTLRNQINASLSAHGGTMPGTDLKTFLATGNTLDRFADNSNSEVQGVAAEVRNALFQAVDNTPGNPTDVLKDFKAAQLRYKAAMTANDAIKGSGSTQAMTPNALKQAIFRHYADQFASGGTGPDYDMPDLARMIQAIPKIASSGTAERQTLYDLALGGGGAALGAFTSPNALTGAIYGMAPLAALTAAGRVSRFGPSMGVPYVAPVLNAVGAYTNPLLPRVLGQGVGNQLMGLMQ